MSLQRCFAGMDQVVGPTGLAKCLPTWLVIKRVRHQQLIVFGVPHLLLYLLLKLQELLVCICVPLCVYNSRCDYRLGRIIVLCLLLVFQYLSSAMNVVS